MKRQLLRKTVIALLLCGAARAGEPVQIDFFYEPGCRDCEKIQMDLLPELGKRFPGACKIQTHDIGIETNFLHLLQLEHDLSYTSSERAYLIVNRQVAYGPTPPHEELFALISNLLKQGADGSAPKSVSPGLAKERFGGFTVPAVAAAGLLDGINPCAISTLVFFMSFLAVSRVRKRRLILLGISYVLSSFLTYLALGFGLFRVLHLFSGFTVFRTVVEWSLAAVLLVLAALSVRDAIRFRKSGRAADVSLQLSTGMKKRIHGVMRHGLGSTSIFLGGLLIGTAVTALESVCTGQVYVPTLVLILKDSTFAELRAWMLLLLYNVLFILPLVTVFIAVYFGLRTDALLAWSRRNVVSSKLLLGLFFVLMALLIFWR
ncbi:MAG: hypothetical protein WC047_04940 [Kiritimatiellales bacterium]